MVALDNGSNAQRLVCCITAQSQSRGHATLVDTFELKAEGREGRPNAMSIPSADTLGVLGGFVVLGFISALILKCMTVKNATTTTTGQSRSSKTCGSNKAAADAVPISHSSGLGENDNLESPVCSTAQRSVCYITARSFACCVFWHMEDIHW